MTIATLVAFALVVLFFLASRLVSWHLSQQINLDAQAITTNAAPSIEALAAIRADLRELHDQLSDEAENCLLRRPVQLDHARELRRNLLGAMREYLALPTFPGEQALQRTIDSELENLRDLVLQAEAQLSAGKCREAHDLVENSLSRAVDRSTVAAVAAMRFNAEQAHSLGEQITNAFYRTRFLAELLTALATVLSIGVMVLLIRVLTRSTRTQAYYLHLQQERADELELFAARVAHDLRGPLTAAHLQLRLMQRSEQGWEKFAESLGRNLRIINDMLDGLYQFAKAAARPAAGGQADVDEVIANLAKEWRAVAEQNGVELTIDATPELHVAAAPGVLTSLLSNLVQNAFKYAGDQGGHITVRTRAHKLIRFEVQDTGPGVPPEIKDHVFDLYRRGTSVRQEGLGLGLATVKRLAESHGGTCGVSNAPARGSIFWFELPKAPSPQRP